MVLLIVGNSLSCSTSILDWPSTSRASRYDRAAHIERLLAQSLRSLSEYDRRKNKEELDASFMLLEGLTVRWPQRYLHLSFAAIREAHPSRQHMMALGWGCV